MTLLTLPPEIINNISPNLDWQSFLASRSTCGTLRSLEMDRGLWTHFIQELEARPGHSRLEAPLSEYTNEELARWALSRFRLDQFWQSATTPQPQARALDASNGIVDYTLLPGGRWMLGIHPSQGKVFAFDLDAATPAAEVLFGVHQSDLEREWCWSYWVDLSKPQLTLRVAVWYRAPDTWNQQEVPIHIYAIELEGHGQDARLRSRHLSSFRHATSGRHLVAGLDGEHFIEIRRDMVSTLTVVKYMDGGQLIPSELIKPMSMVVGSPDAAAIHVLWGSHILLFGKETIAVYPMSQVHPGIVNPSAPEGEDAGPLHSIWTKSMCRKYGIPFTTGIPIRSRYLSRPIILDDAVRFTFASNNTIWGLHIPRNLEKAPSLRKLLDEPESSGRSMGVGYAHSILMRGDAMIALSHDHSDWDDPDFASKCLPAKRYSDPESWLPLDDPWPESYIGGYCEELGRIVVMYEGTLPVVVDLV